MTKLLNKFLLSIALLMFSSQSLAILNVVVLKGAKNIVPIAVLPFYINNGDTSSDMANIISADLRRSGYFSILDNALIQTSQVDPNAINYQQWQDVKVDFLILGNIVDKGNGSFIVSVYMYDVYSQRSILAYRYKANAQAKRKIAHKISDKIYKAILGTKGAFDSYLTYVLLTKDAFGRMEYQIKISDSDGVNAQTLFSSSEPLASPVWSPDNNKIAYISFENGYSEVFIKYPFLEQKTIKLPRFNGIASAPSWHPNGKILVVTFSKNGNKDVYTYHIETQKINRLTTHKGIDTEGGFSPDGKKLIFTSNRSGKAQIYLKNLETGKIKRMSFQGQYNVSARFSPDGKYLVMLSANQGKYQIILLDLKNNEWTIMSQNALDESPYFSPNSQMVIYSSNFNKKSVLSVISIDGLSAHYLSSDSGIIRDPNWSNFLTQQ